jgi:hypothetical protein
VSESRERTLRLRGEVEREHLVQPLGEKRLPDLRRREDVHQIQAPDGQASGGTRQSLFATYDTHVCPAVDISGPAGLDNHRHPVTTSHHPGGEHGHALIHNRMGDTRRETRCDGSQILKPQEDMNMKVHRWKTITALAAAASLALAIGAAPSQAATPVSTKVTRP